MCVNGWRGWSLLIPPPPPLVTLERDGAAQRLVHSPSPSLAHPGGCGQSFPSLLTHQSRTADFTIAAGNYDINEHSHDPSP